MAAEDSRSDHIEAGFPGGGAGLVGGLPASRTWDPIPCAEWVKLSAACEKVVAVPVRRWCVRSARRCAVEWCRASPPVASAPPATEWLRVRVAGSSRRVRVRAVRGISLAESLSEAPAASATIVGVAAIGSAIGTAGFGRRFETIERQWASFRATEVNETGIVRHSGVKSWLIMPHT